MAVEIWPVNDTFAAEIGDVDLSQPLDSHDWAAIEDAYNTYSVLIFPEQQLDNDRHAAFANRFGDIDHSMQKSMQVDDERLPSKLADVSNLGADGEVLDPESRMIDFQRANRLWHTDSSFKPVPANASCLYMRSIPPVGGQTEFADMQAAYDALDDGLRQRIEGRIAVHSIANSRAKLGFAMTPAENTAYPRVPQAMVRRHRATGRRSVYIASHAGEVLGLDVDESRELLAALMAHCTRPEFVYKHRWRANDLVVWDNRCTMHRGRPFDDLRWPRDARRATSLDVAPTPEQEGLAVPSTLIAD